MLKCDKAELRRQIRALFPGAAQRSEESRLLCGHVLCSPLWQRARTVGLYVPLRREADVTALSQAALDGGKTLVLPRVDGEGQMTLRRIASLSQLSPGTYGIPEPAPDLPAVCAADVDLLIVPLEAIDRQGMRLGKGGGYYDRLLAEHPCRTLGAVMSWQWTAAVPHADWDRPLDAAADCDGLYFFDLERKD